MQTKRNILTFILPKSSSNLSSNSPTINNCIKIAKKAGYDGIDVLSIDTNYDTIKFKNVVLAWGNKKISSNDNPKLFEVLKKAENLFILGVDDCSKIKVGYKYNPSQIRHPDNRAWTKLGGINNAKLIEFNIKNYGIK